MLQEYCLDLFEPAGHGRRRKRQIYEGFVDSGLHNHSYDSSHNSFGIVGIPHAEALTSRYNASSIQSAKFNENIEYTVLMPGGKFLFM